MAVFIKAGMCIRLMTPPQAQEVLGVRLPSICDMGPDSGAMICPSPALQNMVDNLPILIDNCIGAKCLVGDHWSSTEQAGNPSDNSWSECFAPGGNSEQCIDIKSELLGVRCSRSLTF